MINTNYLSTESYLAKLETFVQEKASITNETRQIKSQKILDKIEELKLLIIVGRTWPDFDSEIHNALGKISLIKPGRKLLKTILSQNITIRVRESTKASFDIEENVLYISPKMHFYYNFDANRFIKKHNFEVVLAHELIHVIHIHDNAKATIDRNLSTTELIDPEFHCLEEQLTICGLLKENSEIFICENALLKAWKFELRFDHNGLTIIYPSPPTNLDIDHYLMARAYGSLKLHLVQNPESVNQLCLMDWFEKSVETLLFCRNIYPISIAAFKGDKRSINLLIEYGAKIELIDELGGPIITACLNLKFEIANELINISKNKNIHLDTEFLLQRLIERYDQGELPDDEAFYNILWELSNLQKEQLSIGSYFSLFHRVALNCSHVRTSLIEWIKKKEKMHY
jgi:hypothetical protein